MLLDPDQRRRKVQMQAGRRGDRTQRIVAGQFDVMRLAPAGDLARLGQPADNADVNARVIDQVLFDKLPEFPL